MSENQMNENKLPEDPRSVSRGLKIHLGFLGIDSLYVVLEYPHEDVFRKWWAFVPDTNSLGLKKGVLADEFLVKQGHLGYKLSVWDGDTRMLVTDRVNDNLLDSSSAGQGMGIMLQCGSKWLRQHINEASLDALQPSIISQFQAFGISNVEKYPMRLNRLDITADLVGLSVAELSIDEWMTGWVGFATPRAFNISPNTGKLQGFSVGSSEGGVRFKVYDKVEESVSNKTSGFWRSVWGMAEGEETPVARFEWSLKCYEAKFGNARYVSGLNHETLLQLLNYALFWGSLCIPQEDDSNRSRWPLAPIWEELLILISDWSNNYAERAKRDYDFKPDLNDRYLRFITGTIGGLMARVGIERGLDTPSGLETALNLLKDEGHSIPQKAIEKWEILSRLSSKDVEE